MQSASAVAPALSFAIKSLVKVKPSSREGISGDLQTGYARVTQM
jgi:hypothetical protein